MPESRHETYQHDTVRSDFSGEAGGVDAKIFLPPEVADPLRPVQPPLVFGAVLCIPCLAAEIERVAQGR